MNRFITLILMLTTLLTFTQKALAYASVLENKTVAMVNCSISMSADEAHMDMSKTECPGSEMPDNMNCQSDCGFMTVVSVLYFIEHSHAVSQPQLQLAYQTDTSPSPYYFPESIYRPPFPG
ncbi:MAG TPA: hypothetical protein VIS54_03505 [Psychromonas sp.]